MYLNINQISVGVFPLIQNPVLQSADMFISLLGGKEREQTITSLDNLATFESSERKLSNTFIGSELVVCAHGGYHSHIHYLYVHVMMSKVNHETQLPRKCDRLFYVSKTGKRQKEIPGRSNEISDVVVVEALTKSLHAVKRGTQLRKLRY